MNPNFSSVQSVRVERGDALDVSLRHLYDNGYFSDVTLVAGNHLDNSVAFFRAHKVILASVSDFFKNVLTAFESQGNFSTQNQTIFLITEGITVSVEHYRTI